MPLSNAQNTPARFHGSKKEISAVLFSRSLIRCQASAQLFW